jgi:hypothetical protein
MQVLEGVYAPSSIGQRLLPKDLLMAEGVIVMVNALHERLRVDIVVVCDHSPVVCDLLLLTIAHGPCNYRRDFTSPR